MKSIKRGRGPSMMDGMGGIIGAIFGVCWTIGAASLGAPGFFVFFGVVFIAIALANAAYSFANATRKNRFSEYDITDEQEEPDELNRYFGSQDAGHMDERPTADAANYCPFCGEAVEADHRFCSHCGRKLE